MEKIDWSNSAKDIHNKIRALKGAYTLDAQGEVLKIWASNISEVNSEKQLPVGTVLQINKEGFLVKTGSGALQVQEVQPANRKRIAAKDYANGYKLKTGEQFF